MFDALGPIPDSKFKRAQSLVGSSAGRPDDDFYPTPPEAIGALLAVEQFEGEIWEPACGDGAICRVMEAAGYRIKATDLIDRGYGEAPHDFLDSPYRSANIVTNPPFKLAEQFVRLSLKRTTGKVCLLCKVQFLEGVKRKLMFESTPLKRVWVFSKRVTMARNGKRENYSSSMMCFCWFVWEHGFEDDPTLGWL